MENEEAIRVLCINLNIMSFWLKDNYKAERLKFVLEKHGVGIAGLQEACINWSNFNLSQTLASILRAKAEKLRSIASHNERETKNIRRYQWGGAATILHNQLSAFVIDSRSDHTGLGRWSWYLVEGEPGHRTYVITAYTTYGNVGVGVGEYTVYKQHEKSIQKKGIRAKPKTMLREDLISVLQR